METTKNAIIMLKISFILFSMAILFMVLSIAFYQPFSLVFRQFFHYFFNMIQLVKIENNQIILNTNMPPEVFARTRFAEKIKEKGVLAELREGRWNFNPWTFENVTEKDGIIYLRGNAFNGKTADSILKDSSMESGKVHALCKTLCTILESAVNSKVPVANTGAGGIVVSEDFTKAIFLPYNFWTTAVMSAGDEVFSNLNGIYINQNENKEKAIRFMQAVLVYRTIAGVFPFTELNTKKRAEDVLDGNYSLLKWTVPCVNKKITLFTERALASKAAQFPSEEFESYKKAELTEEELLKFKKESEAAANNKKKKVGSKRFVRARQTGLTAGAIAAAVVLLVAGNLRKTALEKPTSKSLTSMETVQMYYNAMNELNVDAAKNCTINLSDRVDYISNLFLKSRTRSMYTRQTDTVTPAAWLIKNQTRHNIWGLTNFYINGNWASLLVEGPVKNTKPEALKEEDGILLKDGDTRKYTVNYDCLDTSLENILAVKVTKETVEVIYKKDRWMVSSIITEEIPAEFNVDDFVRDYVSVMKAESHQKADVLAAIVELKDKYSFLPTEKEIDEGYEYLKKISVFNFD